MSTKPLNVTWISDYPIEWMPELPEPLRHLSRPHPATWQMVLLAEFEKNPTLRLHVVTLRRQIEREYVFERNGTTFHVLKASALARVASIFWLDTWLIKRLCRRVKPDLIHAWGCEKGAGLIGHRLPYPSLMTVQGLLSWYKERIPLQPYDRFIEPLERISLRRAKVLTTESTFAVQFIRKHFPKPEIHQAEHAPNRAFHELARRPQTKPFRFIAVGGFMHRKGSDLLFAALNQLTPELDFKLIIVTKPNPEYVAALRATVSEAFWQRVEFKGHLLPNEVAREFETATMLLMPTRADTSPNAVKEAVVAGVPVVASTVGGIPDYVISGKNGLLFPPEDLPGFVQAIRSACAHPLFGSGRVDPETLTQMRGYLSPELMARKFLAAYNATLAKG